MSYANIMTKHINDQSPHLVTRR